MPALSPQEHVTTGTSSPPQDSIPEVMATEAEAYSRKRRKRMELVNVTVVKEDYEKLKALGGDNTDHVVAALTHYLHALKNTAFRRDPECLGWNRGPVVNFPCGVPKDIANQIRNLPGRFDEHTIEAVRLMFREEASDSSPVSAAPTHRLKAALGRSLLLATCAGLVFFASRILRLVDNLSLINR